MSDQRDTQPSNYFERVNSDLSRSLRRCHALVEDYRSHLLPANSNQPQFMLVDPKRETDGGEEEPEG